MQPNTILILGGGLGGLFTAAILAKEGYQVTVLEKNRNIGGGLQTFMRDGCRFDTGMHVLGGLRKGGAIYRLCQYLGIADRLQLRDVDDDCMDSLHFLCDGAHYRIASGREGFVNSLAAHFPHERENLQRYVDAMYAISDEVPLFNLRPGDEGLGLHSERFLQPVGDFIDSYISDPRLRCVLAYMNPLYGGVREATPAYIHSLINVLYINGTNRFVDGSSQLANALRDVIESNQGRVLAGCEVTQINVQDRNITHIETADGTRHSAQHYISAMHPCTMLRLMSQGAVPRSYISRLDSIPNSYSAFTVYLTLNQGAMPYINHTCYIIDDYDSVWNLADDNDTQWPRGLMYMTPPTSGQGEHATHLIITAPMSFAMVQEWQHSSIGNRPPAYEAWKNAHAQRLIDIVATQHPSLRQGIRQCHASSPLTIRDYYGVKQGSMYGFSKDCRNMALSQLPVYTKVRNLLLTGQCINLHGICGVPLSAITTAEALTAPNHIVNRINHSTI